MPDIGTILTVAQTLFAALECTTLKDVFSTYCYKSDLEDLKLTVSTITKVLLDAEAKQELSNEEKDWIEKLQQVVYDADDLFDEILTLAKQKEQNAGGKVLKEVRDFFSLKNQLCVASTTSQRVKKIRKKLDAFADNHRKFGFVVSSQPTRRRMESCSYAYVGDVVGREDDLKAVIHMLLDSDFRDDVSFLTIVGVGGMGKTTLAQLVYNNERIIYEFSLRLWACVSDQDGEQFDVKTIITKILESATSKKHDNLGMDLLQSELQKELGGKKFLLVLDDVWTEDRYKWSDLRNFLFLGGKGSRIVVTSRSKTTASIIGCEHNAYELKGLSNLDSWRLFESAAFGVGHNQDYPCELVEIGKKIVEYCHNAPLALKVVGSLLYGQDIRRWKSFEDSGLSKIRKGDNEILSILKLSYLNLESPLKSCFRYCALFPKSFVLKKQTLINFWMAQQYIVPFDEGQSIEDAGEEYFSILLRRCFFQDVERDEYDEIKSCKIHDLMHDVAQDVAGKEICFVDSITSDLAATTRHLLHVGNSCTKCFPILKIRSYLRVGYTQFQVSSLSASWRRLRVLDLHDLDLKYLPGSIGKLLHLRYLDLSDNRNLKALPHSITNLCNLQTLNVNNCDWLKLPSLNKLVNLRYLFNNGSPMYCMPPGLDKLTCLRILSAFVGEENNMIEPCVGQLKDLKSLRNLRGSINIFIRSSSGSDVKDNDMEGGYVGSMQHLKQLLIEFGGSRINHDRNVVDYHESLLKHLQPHPNLRALALTGFQGASISRWGREWTAVLPNLVKVYLYRCQGLKILPSLSKLRYLKLLNLSFMDNLEYIENSTCCTDGAAFSSSGSRTVESIFFPSLEILEILEAPKLKGWWGVADSVADQLKDNHGSNSSQPSFSRLSVLAIEDCRNLLSFPPCPSVEELRLTRLNKELRIKLGQDDIGLVSSSTPTSKLQSDIGAHPNLRKVALGNMGYFKLIPVGRLTSMSIRFAEELKCLSDFGELFQSCSSLRNLTIEFCFNLKSLSGGLGYLSALESLTIECCSSALFAKEDDDELSWKSVAQTLRTLDLRQIRGLESLPKGWQYLTSLQCLKIHAFRLKEIPEWISCLSSLQSLSLMDCDDLVSLPNAFQKLSSFRRLEILRCSKCLARRCRNPNGEDWPKIQHIPSISISESFSF